MSKVIKNLFVFVVSLMFVLSFGSCVPEPEVEDVSIEDMPSGVKSYQDKDFELISASEDYATLVYMDNENIPEMKTGEMIIHQLRDGYEGEVRIREIVSIEKANGNVNVTTILGNICKLLPTNSKVDINTEDMTMQIEYGTNNSVSKKRVVVPIVMDKAYMIGIDLKKEEIGLPLRGTNEYTLIDYTYDKSLNGLKLWQGTAPKGTVEYNSINLNGSMNFTLEEARVFANPKVKIGWETGFLSLESFWMKADIDAGALIKSKIELTGGVSGGMRTEFPIYALVYPVILPCPPYLVELIYSVHPGFSVGIDDNITSSFGVEANMNVSGEIRWTNGSGWSTTIDKSITGKWIEPTYDNTVAVSLTGEVHNRFRALFAGFGGPEFRLTPYGKLTVDSNWTGDIKIGVKGQIGANLSIFGIFDIASLLIDWFDYEYKIYDIENGNGNEPEGPPQPIVLNTIDYADTSPTLSWQSDSLATSYYLKLDNNSDFSSPIVNKNVGDTLSYMVDGLTVGTTYYWKVYGKNASGNGEWSAVDSFEVRQDGETFDGWVQYNALLYPEDAGWTNRRPNAESTKGDSWNESIGSGILTYWESDCHYGYRKSVTVDTSTGFTLEFRARHTGGCLGIIIYTSEGKRVYLYIHGNTAEFYGTSGSTTIDNAEKFHIYRIVLKNNTSDLYIDGVKKLSKSLVDISGGSEIIFKSWYSSSTSYWDYLYYTIEGAFMPHTAPEVVIANKIAGVKNTKKMDIVAEVYDSYGFEKVEFIINGSVQKTVNVTPENQQYGTYKYTWDIDSPDLSNGTYTVKVKVTDTQGETAEDTWSVQVYHDTTKPSVSITNPVEGSVSGIVSIEASASDDSEVARVEFFVDGTTNENKIGIDVEPDNGYTCEWDTTEYTSGSHTLVARAYDAAGNYKDSEPVTVINHPPRAYWKMNEGSGSTTIIDSSGYENTGTIYGADWTTDSVSGNAALSFTSSGCWGNGDTVIVPDSPSLSLSAVSSIEAWVKRGTEGNSSDVGACRLIVDKEADFKSNYYLIARNASCGGWLVLGYTSPGGTGYEILSAKGSFPANEWTHVVGIINWETNSMKLYINGELIKTGTAPVEPGGNDAPLYIGAHPAGISALSLTIDEVSFYNPELNADEVLEHYISRGRYEANVLPTEKGWNKHSWGSGNGTVGNSILTLNGSGIFYWREDINASTLTSVGTLEARLLHVSGSYPAVLYVSTANYYLKPAIKHDNVLGVSFTPNVYHTFRLSIDDTTGIYNLYIDGELKKTGSANSGNISNLKYGDDAFMFGNEWGGGPTTKWDYVYYHTGD